MSLTHDQIVSALMNGVDPWELAEKAGPDKVNEAIEYLENWAH